MSDPKEGSDPIVDLVILLPAFAGIDVYHVGEMLFDVQSFR